MYERDRDVGLQWGRDSEVAVHARRIGDNLLFLDELEDTLDVLRRTGGESPERIQALEQRVSTERAKIRALETRGMLRYGEIERAMEAIDLSG